MNDLVNQFVASRDCKSVMINPLKYEVTEPNGRKLRVHFSIRDDCWFCECKYCLINGIPCQHVILMLNYFGGVMEYYINGRWIHNKQEKIVKRMGPYITNKRRRK